MEIRSIARGIVAMTRDDVSDIGTHAEGYGTSLWVEADAKLDHFSVNERSLWHHRCAAQPKKRQLTSRIDHVNNTRRIRNANAFTGVSAFRRQRSGGSGSGAFGSFNAEGLNTGSYPQPNIRSQITEAPKRIDREKV